MKKRAYGFTIVELLIVIVVIAILAAISIVAYRGIQDRANDSSARSAARQAATKLQVAFAENDTYPASLSSIGITNAGSTTYQYKYNNTVSPSTFCVTATTNNKSYYVSNTTTTPTEGGCSGHGQGGQQPITNLAAYPNFTGSGAIATGWGPYSSGTNTVTRSVSGGVQTITATTLAGTNRRVGVYNNAIALGENARGKYISARIKIDATSVPSDIRLRFHVELYNNGVYTTEWSTAPVASPSITELIINPTLINHDGNRLNPYVWFNPVNAVDWSGTATLGISEFSIFVSDTAVTPRYYDGNSPNWDWNGTANASSSSGPAL